MINGQEKIKNAILSLFDGNSNVEMHYLKKTKEPTYIALSNDEGVSVNKLPHFVLTWEHFYKLIHQVNKVGGEMIMGDSLAQSGERLGYSLNSNCVDGFISIHCLGKRIGKKDTRRSTYYCGILDTADVITMHKSKGFGSYITVNEGYRDI